MTSLGFLIPLSIVVLVLACVVLFWAIDDGQFEDTEAPALLPVLDAELSRATDPDAQARSARDPP